MPTNEPTPPSPQTAGANDTERHDTPETVANTFISLTAEEAQNHWDELIDRVITTQGPVHIASPAGGLGAVLMSIEAYQAVRVQKCEKPSQEDTPYATETRPDDAARQ